MLTKRLVQKCLTKNTTGCCIFVSDNLEIQIMVSTILPKEWTKLTILSKDDAQDSEFHLFFLEEFRTTYTDFGDLLTGNSHTKYDKLRATISMKRLIIKGRLYCTFLFSEQIWEKIRRIRYVLDSMTSLLALKVAHPTKWRFLPKDLN